MTKFALFGTVALVCVAAATPVKAQEVIYNPGYCAQFYPNADCQNKGPNNPYTGDYQRRTPFVIPTAASFRRFLDTIGKPNTPPTDTSEAERA